MSGIEALLLKARLAWDGDEATRGMDAAGGQAEKLESKISGAFKKIGTAVAAAFTIDAIKNFVVSTVEAGAEVSAETAAFQQIMGDYTDQAAEKMKTVADNVGMVDTRMTPYMTSMTAKFKGLGYGVEDATDMAARGLTLAADSSAFWDKSLDESMSHLNSFINGSYEGGEAIGLFANDSQMAAYAVESGVIKSTKAWANLDEATKQATRLEYAENMMKQSGATGQAAKESGAYANVMANLAEKWRQFKAQIGTPIINNVVIPAVNLLSKGVDALSKGIEYVRQNFRSWMAIAQKLAPALGAVIAVYAGFKVGTAIQGVVTGFQKARVAVALFTAGQTKAQIATKLSTGALKAHEIIVGLMTGKIKLAQLATALWTKVQAGLNMVLTANPIGLVVAAIAAIVAALVLAYKKSDTFRKFVDKLWASLKNKLQPVIKVVGDWISKTLVPAFQKVGEFINTRVVPALQSLGTWLKDHILSAVRSVANWISGTLVPTLRSWGDYIKTNIVPALQELGAAISERLQPIFQWISNFITTKVAPAFRKIVSTVQSVLTEAAPILDAIKIAVSTAFENIRIVATTVWNLIRNAVSTALRVIQLIIKGVTSAIQGDWSGAWEAVKQAGLTIWEGIRSAVSIAIEGVRSVISNTLSGIRSAWSIAWTTVKAVASRIWEGIKTAISGKFQEISKNVSEKVTFVKNLLNFKGLSTSVSLVFATVKKSILDKIEEAKKKVGEIVDGIVGFFTGAKFEWPSIPLPHFSVKPKGWEIGDLLTGSIPSLGIEWYAKAMDNAMVLKDPTIFGAAGGRLLGGGEAGNEVVAGEDHLIGLITAAVQQNNAEMLAVLANILNVLRSIDVNMYDRIVDGLVDGVRIKWDGREFGRLVKTYA